MVYRLNAKSVENSDNLAGSAQFANDKLSSKIVTYGRLSGTIRKRICNILKQFLTASIQTETKTDCWTPLGLDAYFKILSEFN